MFDSLDEQMKVDAHKASSNTERIVRWLLIVLISILVFGGVILGVHFTQ